MVLAAGAGRGWVWWVESGAWIEAPPISIAALAATTAAVAAWLRR
jgi:hypothetical protein